MLRALETQTCTSDYLYRTSVSPDLHHLAIASCSVGDFSGSRVCVIDLASGKVRWEMSVEAVNAQLRIDGRTYHACMWFGYHQLVVHAASNPFEPGHAFAGAESQSS